MAGFHLLLSLPRRRQLRGRGGKQVEKPRDQTSMNTNGTEAQRVEAGQFGLVMNGLRTTQLGAAFSALAICAVSWEYAPPALVVIWGALWCALSAGRYLTWRRYAQVIRTQPLPRQLDFARKLRWIWFVHAISWGAAPLVFAGRLPVAQELACWLLLACAGVMVMAWLSAYVPAGRDFLLTLIGCVIVCMAISTATSAQPLAAAAPSLGLAAAVLLLWTLMLGAAGRMHRLALRGIVRGYRSQRLIESLRMKTSAAQKALRSHGRYLVSAAHDLKQPVNALSIYAQWLHDEPQMANEIAARIMKSTQAINAQFDALFNLARLDAGPPELQTQPVDLSELLTTIEAQFRPLAVQKGLTLRVRPLPVSLNTDPVILRRILSNLVSNAVRYTTHGGVLLAARKRGNAVSLEVWDTGIGIAAEEREKVFGEFYKVQAENANGGMGIGLSIARRLAGSLGHSITLRSRLGHGTVFKVLAGPVLPA